MTVGGDQARAGPAASGANHGQEGLLQQRLDQYARLKPLLKHFRREVEEEIRGALLRRGIVVDRVSSRVKTRRSLRDKLCDHPDRKIEDLVGVRVIVLHQSDLPAVESAIRSVLEVHRDSGPRIDKQALQGSSEFGYRSIQFVAHLRPGVQRSEAAATGDSADADTSWLGSPVGTVEIQLRTVLAHGWAEVEHKLVYKRPAQLGRAPRELKRRLAMAAALTETADTLLDDARQMAEPTPSGRPAARHESRENWLKDVVDTHAVSRRLDRQIAAVLDVPLGFPDGHRRQVGDAIRFAELDTADAVEWALEEHDDLARRAAMVCEDTGHGLVSPDSDAAREAPPEAYPGIGLYWAALVHACLTPPSDFRSPLRALRDGRLAEYFAVIRYLESHPDESAVAVRDRYRRVAAPAGAASFPAIEL